MDIVKLMATCNNHHQNDFELERNNPKRFTRRFFSNKQKWGRNKSILRHFPTHGRLILNVHYKVDKIPFRMDIVKLMATCNNHHQNDFELERNNPKRFTRRFSSNKQKWGRNKSILRHFPTHGRLILNVHYKVDKIPFRMDIVKLMATCNNHHRNDFELERNNPKRFTRRFSSNNQKWGRNKVILRHFPTHGRLILNVHYKVDKIPFRMDIVKLMATCNNHHQNDFELERNNPKRFTRRFSSNKQKWGRNKSILRHFPTHGRLILNVHYKVDKIPFCMDIVKLMATCNNHHQNDFELERNNPKRFTRRFSSNKQKWGRNKSILRHFPTHGRLILNVHYKVDKIPFRMDIVKLMATCNNHHQNDFELERNNPKRFTRRFF